MICPACKFSNIEGVDECEACGESLMQEMPATLQKELLGTAARDHLSAVKAPPAVMVSATTPLSEVVRGMIEGNTSCVLVTDGGRLIGICSERDLLYKAAHRYHEMRACPVGEIMTPNPQALPPTATIAWAMNRMDDGGFRHVPIVENNRPVGVVSIRDLLAHLGKKYLATAK